VGFDILVELENVYLMVKHQEYQFKMVFVAHLMKYFLECVDLLLSLMKVLFDHLVELKWVWKESHLKEYLLV
jgi:hypothetical protein